MLNPREPKKRRRKSLGIKIKRGDLLLKTRGEKKTDRGELRGKEKNRESCSE